VTDTNREKTAAVVVTYNRKELLGACLESLLRQTYPLDAIYVVDNCSTDGTYDYLLERDLISPIASAENGPSESVKAVAAPAPPGASVEIRYVRMPENTGGAGGFHEGIRRGCADRFDWLWLMDDDLLIADEALEALIRKREILLAARGRSFLLNSLVLSKDRPDGDTLAFPLQELAPNGYPRIGIYHHHLSEVAGKVEDGLYRWACPFNGTLIPAVAIAQIGLPNRDFFIKGDEKDFLWRAARTLTFYTVVDSKAYHPRPHANAFDWKQYYHIRNMLVVNRHFPFTALRNTKLIAVSLIMGMRHGKRGTVLVLRAVRDGLAGHLGKRDDVRAWLTTL